MYFLEFLISFAVQNILFSQWMSNHCQLDIYFFNIRIIFLATFFYTFVLLPFRYFFLNYNLVFSNCLHFYQFSSRVSRIFPILLCYFIQLFLTFADSPILILHFVNPFILPYGQLIIISISLLSSQNVLFRSNSLAESFFILPLIIFTMNLPNIFSIHIKILVNQKHLMIYVSEFRKISSFR